MKNLLKLSVLITSVLFTFNFAKADQLTIKSNISATDLHPDAKGIKLVCMMYFDSARSKKFGLYPTLSEGITRNADGTAAGVATVTFTDWLPDAKYYGCYLALYDATKYGPPVLPNESNYTQVEMWRRAKSGTLNQNGMVE